jgi:DNA-binding Lrp family transcriptional regulator
MKDVELRLISELMKNSRRSDRELAKALGVSQPTVSRMIKKLEKEGVIKEYTMIPDFRKLGYQIMAVAFFGKQETEKEGESRELRKAVVELEKKTPFASLIVVNGIGIGKGRMLINLYKDYSSYAEGMDVIRSLPHVEPDKLESFLVDLKDERNYRILTLAETARHLQAFGKKLKEES